MATTGPDQDPSPNDVLDVIDNHRRPFITVGEVADILGTRETVARELLDELEESRTVESGMVRDRGELKLYWLPSS